MIAGKITSEGEAVLGIEGGALLGMALLHGSRLSMDVVADGPLRIEPISDT